jgi:hypothetical protein
MNYIVHMIGGTKFTINEQDYKNIVRSTGTVTLASSGISLNTDRIETIYPESQAEEVEDRKAQTTGILHDGSVVRRHFGRWVDAQSSAIDENQNYVPVTIDPSYYPEVAHDCVPSEKEYHELYEKLPTNEARLNAILKNISGDRKRISDGKFHQIKDTIRK